MGTFSAWHLAIVLGVVVLLFGSKKLPEMARSLGKSARILKSEAAAMKAENGEKKADETTLPPSRPAS
ncbi:MULTISPECIES: Sec-independent protein translocase subunit TatA [Streptomyces]|uniref:Sec-independent protein translocase protein TatA n=2 Tax=Streptomyces TaxID=1883 RepID=A0A1D8FWC3_9ACTN|nr:MULTISPECIES: Sec-independent protein translocase subunit TatA [Streptomyces]AOT57517.1 twin arginine translocase protein A [Streptomyces rubrolavendulae]KAF0648943.1 twin-arginine translocation protein, TatA/E family subunit [Streptomyces fradiae ATCC 10745 = DSM 40063]OSY51658.1 twin arginine translocase protein A [Streptomyces fradiae ATCC 10745 = DSM 40063]QEV10917.1 Sec-independent protein translocase subunit TatA [Streptomyces fradiae ATCC 10745 = DSM 40063]WOI60629.1 Sec-independent 